MMTIVVIGLAIGAYSTAFLHKDDPVRAQVLNSSYTLLGNAALLLVTWIYVQSTKKLVETNLRQQELLFPKLSMQVKEVRCRDQKVFTDKDVSGQLILEVVLNISNPSPLTNDTVWFEDAVVTAPALKLERYIFSCVGTKESLDASQLKLASGESRMMHLYLFFTCDVTRTKSAENHAVAVNFRDAFGNRTPVEFKIPSVKDV